MAKTAYCYTVTWHITRCLEKRSTNGNNVQVVRNGGSLRFSKSRFSSRCILILARNGQFCKINLYKILYIKQLNKFY